MSTYNTIHQIALYLYPPPASLNELTDEFFNYANNHHLTCQFAYKQVNQPIFDYKGVTHQCRSVKLSMIVKSPYTPVPYHVICPTIVACMNKLEFQKSLGIYRLDFTPVVFDPHTFEPRASVIIKYATLKI